MSRHYCVPAFIMLLASAGCTHDALNAPEFMAEDSRGIADGFRWLPLKARLEGVSAVPADPTRCVPLLTAGNVTHGNMTHLGRVIGEHSQCIDPTGELQNPLEFSDGEVTFTGANGDQLFVTFAGVLTPTEIPGVLAAQNPFIVVGGTGRFVGAQGGGTATGSLDVRVPETPLILNLDGTLILPRHTKKDDR